MYTPWSTIMMLWIDFYAKQDIVKWQMIINWKYQITGDGMQKTKRINIGIWATVHLPLP